MDKIKIKAITLIRVEGPNEQCGKEITRTTWSDANFALRQMSDTAPEKGGYDKVDFRVVFADGFVYSSRYDLKHWRVELPNLQDHVRGLADFYTGKAQPSHMTPEQYREFLDRPHSRHVAEAYGELLHAYEV